jgi:hypothetical protein
MLWAQFAELEPELARRGAYLLAETHGYSYLATVSRAGTPRIHPVAPILSARGLFIAVTRSSPKLKDLVTDHRMALHATVLPPVDEEFAVRGVAHEVAGGVRRSQVIHGTRGGAALHDGMALFAVDLDEVTWATWVKGHAIRKRWRDAGGQP